MKIFISYSWDNYAVVDELETFFWNKKGVKIIRDVRDLTFKSNIKEYMKKIREVDYAITVVSDEYLKSVNCMYEIVELYKDTGAENKILPLVLPSAAIYDIRKKSKYLKYWGDLYRDQILMLSEIPPDKGIEARNELKLLSDIFGHVDTFISCVLNRKHARWSDSDAGKSAFKEISGYLEL